MDLFVRVLDGTLAIRSRVMAYAKIGESHANISFTQSNDRDAEVRVSINRADMNWSLVGTVSLDVPHDDPTMNLQLHDDDSDDTLSMEKEAVYAYHGSKGLSRQEVDDHVFSLLLLQNMLSAPFDQDTVMLSPIPAHLTYNLLVVQPRIHLSPRDISFNARSYPTSSELQVVRLGTTHPWEDAQQGALYHLQHHINPSASGLPNAAIGLSALDLGGENR
ncbi:hypothetical protein MMC22_010194 [Lobaria immixta]|nr:hypothetical protein [Lobaria immixta]